MVDGEERGMKMHKIKKLTGDDIFHIAVGIIAVVVLIVSGISFVGNMLNEISEGTVVDKEFYPAHTTTRTTTIDGETVYLPEYVPDKYYLTIEGEKNGKAVEYRFRATALEYDRYSVGDYYKR